MPTATIGDLPPFEVAKHVFMAGAMDARDCISTTLAEDEIHQQFPGVKEDVITDMERSRFHIVTFQQIIPCFCK